MRKRLATKVIGSIKKLLSKKAYLSLFLLALILPVALGLVLMQEKKNASVDSFNIDVIPLVRSAYFQFRLDLLTGLPAEFYAPGTGSILQIPETHKAELYWCPSELNCVNTPDSWKKAQSFVRVQDNGGYGDPINFHTIRDPRMAVMLFGLEEGKSYNYKVVFTGVGYPTTPIVGSFTTLSSDVVSGSNIIAVNNTVPIRSTVQNIISSGSSGKTIEFASTTPGQTAIFRDRIIDYYDTYNLSASADNWVTLRGKSGDKIIFDGSDPSYDVVNQGLWIECTSDNNYCSSGTTFTGGAKVYRTKNQYYDPANVDKNYSPSDPLRPRPASIYYEEVTGGDAWILQNISSLGLGTLSSRSIEQPNEGTFVNKDGYLYVHLRKGRDPNSVNAKIPVIKSPIELEGSQHVLIENLTLQYFKDQFGGRLYIADSHDITIKNVEFKGVLNGIGAGSFVTSPKKNIIVKNCKFSIRGLNPEFNTETGQWEDTVWGHVKASPEETWPIRMNGTGVSIIDSEFLNYSNAITGGEFFIPDKDYSIQNHQHPMAWEIDNNYFEGISDDAVEMESWAIGVGITRNKFNKNYKDISSAPLNGGPLYVLRNISTQWGEYYSVYKQAPIKFGNKSYGFDNGYKFFANNTFINVNKSYTVNSRTAPGFDQSGPTSNLNIFNNYMVSDNAPIMFSDDGYSCYPQIFDHNLYMATRFDLPFGGQPAGQFAMVASCPQQGDSSTDMRGSMTFQDWQNGKNTRAPSDVNKYWPMSPLNPASASDPNYDTEYHSKVTPWIHDPHGKFLSYSATNLAPSDYNLINPTNALTGNFTPKAGSPNVAMGMDLANITYDVGPGWAEYEEPKGMVTAGAMPAENGTTPVVFLSPSASTYENLDLTIEPSVLNANTFLWSKVNESDPIEFISSSSVKDVKVRSAFVTGKDNSFRLKLAVTSSAGIVSDNNFIDIHIHKLADIDGKLINNKYSVDFTDFSLLLSSWGKPLNSMADIDRSGTSFNTVDFKDFSVLLSKWGNYDANPTGEEPLVGYFISPTGSDGAAGTINAPWKTFAASLPKLRAGDTLYARAGDYIENMALTLPKGTSTSRIVVKAYPNEKPTLKGLIRFTGADYWTFDGINVTWNAGNYTDHMLKINGGVGWIWENSEIWGARSFANILIAEAPSNWVLRNNIIHDTFGGEDNVFRSHNIYANTGLDAGPGLIERNLIFNADHGCNLKLAGSDETAASGAANVTVRYNTIYNGTQPVAIAGGTKNILIEKNIIGKGTRPDSQTYLYRLLTASGTNNLVKDNIGFAADMFCSDYNSTINTCVNTMTNNIFPLDPQFDNTTIGGFHPQNLAAKGYGKYAE